MMKAVIMAGGEGTRLRPLTCKIPKPMVPVVNRPMMEHILNLLKRHQITEIANTLWYLPDHIRDYFGDGEQWNVNMEYFVEEKPLGTAGSVKNAQDFLTEPFVVVSGDSLTDIDLSAAIRFHQQKGSLATIVLTKVDNPLSYGVVITAGDGKITKFLEKPGWSQVFSDTVNTGIYILEPEVLAKIAFNEKYDFSQDLFPRLLAEQAPLYGYIAEGYWSDVGNLDVYRRSQQDCLDGKLWIEMPVPVRTGVWIEDGARIAADAVLEGPVYIGRESKVSDGAYVGPYTIVGDHGYIAAGASLKRSTLWNGVNVGKESQIRGTILTSQVFLEDKVKTFEGAVIGEKTRIGLQTMISPNVKVWPGKQVISGSTLNQALVWGHQEDPAIFTETGMRGDIRGLLTPEMITKIGLAYGAWVGCGKNLLVTADGSKIGRITKRSLTAGLLSAGVHVLDGGTVSGNLTRYGVAYLQANGALHCHQVTDQENQINIQAWDKDGYWLAKGDQRKIENLFWRDDFPRPSCEDLGELSYVPSLVKQYVASVVELYSNRLTGLAVGLTSDASSPLQEGGLAALVLDFLEKAGCSVSEDASSVQILIDGDRWSIKDERDEELNEDHWWELYSQVLARRQTGDIAVPIDVSHHISQSAKAKKLGVHWTKKDQRAWMEIASELGNTVSYDGHKGEFFPYIEPLISIAEILSFLKETGQPLHSLRSTVASTRLDKTVFCPWKDKGRVMRTLMNSADVTKSSFVDGLKHHTASGWALVIPDGDNPVFNISTEAETVEEANHLADYYTKTIENILQGEGAH